VPHERGAQCILPGGGYVTTPTSSPDHAAFARRALGCRHCSLLRQRSLFSTRRRRWPSVGCDDRSRCRAPGVCCNARAIDHDIVMLRRRTAEVASDIMRTGAYGRATVAQLNSVVAGLEDTRRRFAGSGPATMPLDRMVAFDMISPLVHGDASVSGILSMWPNPRPVYYWAYTSCDQTLGSGAMASFDASFTQRWTGSNTPYSTGGFSLPPSLQYGSNSQQWTAYGDSTYATITVDHYCTGGSADRLTKRTIKSNYV
jgi:hypothetical protein